MTDVSKVTKKDLQKVYLRTLIGLTWGWNYEKMQAMGYAFSIMPVLKRLYGSDSAKMKTALQTHLGFFNTTPAMAYLIIGANAGLEDEVGMEDPEAIIGLKTGLMGPFAGVGDTIFIALYRAIVFSIAAYMALAGQILGLVIPIITGALILWVQYKFVFIGFAQGRRIATEFGTQMKLFTEAAAILGLTVVGSLIPSVITYTLDITYTMGDVTLSIQDILNQIMPGLVPLAIVMLSYWLLGKKNMNSTRLIFALIVLGMILGNLQNMIGWFGNLI